MSVVSTSTPITIPSTPKTSGTSFNDVTDCVKSWGLHGLYFGACFGFVFGAIFVAIPFTADVLTFGTIGTLLVEAVECAIIAGAFAALAAALFAKGVRVSGTAQFKHILTPHRRSAVAYPQDIALAARPGRRAYPVQSPEHPLQQVPDEGSNLAFSQTDAQARLNTIDAWEYGNSGP